MIAHKRKRDAPPQAEMTPEEKHEADKRRKERLIKQLKRDALIKITGSAAVLLITFSCIFGIALAPTNDMFPAIHHGDLIIYYRPGRIVDTDVVIYEAPDSSLQIGRVEGIQGETVGKTDGGLLTINGNIQPVQKRSGLYDETLAGERDISGTIGPGEFLILGDRRETAEDSRSFGLISREEIRGKVFTIVRRRPL